MCARPSALPQSYTPTCSLLFFMYTLTAINFPLSTAFATYCKFYSSPRSLGKCFDNYSHCVEKCISLRVRKLTPHYKSKKVTKAEIVHTDDPEYAQEAKPPWHRKQRGFPTLGTASYGAETALGTKSGVLSSSHCPEPTERSQHFTASYSAPTLGNKAQRVLCDNPLSVCVSGFKKGICKY